MRKDRSVNVTANEKIFRLVRHHDVAKYLQIGWHIAQVDLAHHSDYSVLMQWLCSCKVKEPQNGVDSS